MERRREAKRREEKRREEKRREEKRREEKRDFSRRGGFEMSGEGGENDTGCGGKSIHAPFGS
jgi:hypothetical protein